VRKSLPDGTVYHVHLDGHLMPTPKPPAHVCTVCHVNPVDAEGGFDTCDECLAQQ
jgi:hypothetical protein